MVSVLAAMPLSLVACGGSQKKDKLICESRATTGTHISRPVCWKKEDVEDRQQQDQHQLKRETERIKRPGRPNQ